MSRVAGDTEDDLTDPFDMQLSLAHWSTTFQLPPKTASANNVRPATETMSTALPRMQIQALCRAVLNPVSSYP